MKSIFYFLLLSVAFVGVSCGDDDDEGGNGGNTSPTVFVKATIGESAFETSELSVSSSKSGGITSITARSGDDGDESAFFISLYGDPEVKTYTLTENSTEDGMSVIYYPVYPSSASKSTYRMTSGEFTIDSYEDKMIKGSFSGTVINSPDEDKLTVTSGTFSLMIPE